MRKRKIGLFLMSLTTQKTSLERATRDISVVNEGTEFQKVG